ncbi:TonB-dependent receptor [Methylocystis sp. IM3]|uniref:TonB-dependent receptor n=1 Tax=unclassified Methylocystis TaxID=2625913 RepID=UPI0030F5E7FB
MFARRTQISLAALLAACCAGEAFAQATLPTINVGGRQPRRVASKPAPRTQAPVRAVPAVVAAQPAPGPVEPSTEQDTALGPKIDYPTGPKQMTSSSERFFTGGQVNAIPFYRPGEALEIVPGLAVTQHSGEGKANQYYLRGFDLDHGTDLALYLDDMPLNMRTHGHGQGYADANFVMPELLASVDARKGPYNVEDGDFSNAGTIRMQYLKRVPQGVFTSSAGEFGYGRQFGMKSWSFMGGDILGAAEATIYNGPWVVPNNVRKINAVMRYSRGDEANGFGVTGMAYANHWTSTDQLPLRAVDTGLISRWGSLSPTDGGDTTRFSLSGHWNREGENNYSRVNAYAIHSTLELYNNFTYFLTNPVLGDQFRQFDRRTILGSNGIHGIRFNFLDFPSELRFGYQTRWDDIRVGLQDTFRRAAYDAIRNDAVAEGNMSLLTDVKTKWAPWLTTIVGARYDYYWASVNGLQSPYAAPIVGYLNEDPAQPVKLWTAPYNSGASAAQLISPKASVIINPFDDKTDFYLNFGRGFHSTDARGTTQNYSTNEATDDLGYLWVAKRPLLSPSTAAEVGVKTKAIDRLESALTLFWIQLRSENVFAGDSGNTVFGPPSRRLGVEFTNHYRPLSWLSFEGDVTATYSRFIGFDQEQAALYQQLLQPDSIAWGTFLGNAPGNYLVNAPPIVATAVVEFGESTGWFSAFKYRYISQRPLTADGFLQSPAIGVVNARAGYRWKDGWKLQLDVFNMFNSRSQAIAYGYGSLIPTDPLYQACNGLINVPASAANCGVGVMDVHGHPVEPPTWRLTFSGPLNYDTLINNTPDVTEPFKLVKFWE